MLTKDELTKEVKLIAQNAWRQETNTTVNAIVEYVVREAIFLLNDDLNEQITELQTAAIALQEELDGLAAKLSDNESYPTPVGTIVDASTNGGISQPQGNTQTQDKVSRSRATKAG